MRPPTYHELSVSALHCTHPSKVIVGQVDYIMEAVTLSFVIDKIKSIPVTNFADDPELLHWRWTGRDRVRTSGPGPTHTEDSTHTFKRPDSCASVPTAANMH